MLDDLKKQAIVMWEEHMELTRQGRHSSLNDFTDALIDRVAEEVANDIRGRIRDGRGKAMTNRPHNRSWTEGANAMLREALASTRYSKKV